ncbi:methyl-accepting chemotaxis protein [Pseudomonas sp. GCM10022186]|uniref:methyl-accepting chemotaxis protein n=1 Tax=Pseudomonas sp. GCM10022186 TaxID=3252650 RepID=UPI00361F042B
MNKSLKFSQKILLAALVVVLTIFAVFALYNDSLLRSTTKQNTEAHLRDIGQVIASNIQSWMGGRILAIETMIQNIELDPSPEHVDAVLAAASLSKTFNLTSLGGEDGSFRTNPPSDMPDGYDPRVRPWYKNAVAAGGTTLTEPYIDLATNALVVSIIAPVRHDGRLIGAGGGDLSLEALVKIVNSLDLGGLGYAFLVSGDGKVLVSPEKDQVMKSLAEIYPQRTPALSQQFSEVELNGSTRVITFTKIDGLPSVNWYIGLSIDKEGAYAALNDFRYSAIVAVAFSVSLIVVLLGLLIRYLLQPLRDMSSTMRDIADGEGDLTKRLALKSRDEFGELAQSFNRFVERVHSSIREVSTATDGVSLVAQHVLAASNSSLTNSDEQATRTNSVAAAINELGAAAQEIARNAADASQQASNARSQTDEGRRVVEHTMKAMSELSEKISSSCSIIETLNSKTVNIGQILEVIKGISEQTNLLALNAAIEAARAGEAGRGFAVVADEVRSLAHRTQQSAQEIHRMIEELQVGAREAVVTMTESQRHSEESVLIANQAGDRLGSVTHRIAEIDGMNQSVATATEEQTAVVESLNVDITEINTLNQSGVENLQATLKACSDLDRQAARLQQLVGGFRI